MGPHRVVVDPPALDDPPGLRERNEDIFVEAFIPQLPVEGFHESVLNRLAWRDVMPLDAVSSTQLSTALLVNSVPLSETIINGLPCIPQRRSNSLMTCVAGKYLDNQILRELALSYPR